MIKQPKQCKRPAHDMEMYTLTATDIKAMKRATDTILSILSFYSNMPENRTGELAIKDCNVEKFDSLCESISDIKTMLYEVDYQ